MADKSRPCLYAGCIFNALPGSLGCKRHPDAQEPIVARCRRLEKALVIIEEQVSGNESEPESVLGNIGSIARRVLAGEES